MELPLITSFLGCESKQGSFPSFVLWMSCQLLSCRRSQKGVGEKRTRERGKNVGWLMLKVRCNGAEFTYKSAHLPGQCHMHNWNCSVNIIRRRTCRATMLADNSVNTQRGRGSCKSVTGTNWSCTYTTMDVADEDNWCMGHLTTGVGWGLFRQSQNSSAPDKTQVSRIHISPKSWHCMYANLAK